MGQLRFIDSLRFLNCSLATLASNLTDADLVQLRRHFPSSSQRQLLAKKGVYPYDYMSSMDRFDETSLPTQEQFYNRLTGQHISDEDYAHAQTIWRVFNCKTMRDYHDLYLKTDVLLLADVFERFRATCLQIYKLDPLHYFSLPGFSWDAALKHSGVKLDLITDIEMYQFVERGIRGGVSMISHRHAEATDTHSLIYLDANSLYAWAMRQPLPVSHFEWFDAADMDVASIPDDGEYGYFFEVDLEYPKCINYTTTIHWRQRECV